jgi:hypothetical protein
MSMVWLLSPDFRVIGVVLLWVGVVVSGVPSESKVSSVPVLVVVGV